MRFYRSPSLAHLRRAVATTLALAVLVLVPMASAQTL